MRLVGIHPEPLKSVHIPVDHLSRSQWPHRKAGHTYTHGRSHWLSSPKVHDSTSKGSITQTRPLVVFVALPGVRVSPTPGPKRQRTGLTRSTPSPCSCSIPRCAGRSLDVVYSIQERYKNHPENGIRAVQKRPSQGQCSGRVVTRGQRQAREVPVSLACRDTLCWFVVLWRKE